MEIKELCRQDYMAGMSAADIARKHNQKAATVRQWIKRYWSDTSKKKAKSVTKSVTHNSVTENCDSEEPTPKKKVGRPRVEIDKKIFENLCGLMCTREDIAEFFECDTDTITDWCKATYGEDFSATYKRKCARGRISLRRSQFKAAENGNTSMMIFLGKAHLGQSDLSTTELELRQQEIDLKKREVELKEKLSDTEREDEQAARDAAAEVKEFFRQANERNKANDSE